VHPVSHQCRPTCAPCVREAAQVLGEIRAELLPRLDRTIPVTYIVPKESSRGSTAA